MLFRSGVIADGSGRGNDAESRIFKGFTCHRVNLAHPQAALLAIGNIDSGKQKEKDTSARERTFSELMNAEQDNTLDAKEKRKYIVEGHRRILTPLFNLLFALLGCTGLLVGNFNRRGQSRIISVSIISMVLIQALDLAFGNMAAKKLNLLPLLYANLFIPMAICFYLLRFYRPGMFGRRRKQPEELTNA